MAYQCKQRCLPPPIFIKGNSIRCGEVCAPRSKSPCKIVCSSDTCRSSCGTAKDTCGAPCQPVCCDPCASKIEVKVERCPDPCCAAKSEPVICKSPCVSVCPVPCPPEPVICKSPCASVCSVPCPPEPVICKSPCASVCEEEPCGCQGQSGVCQPQSCFPFCIPPCQGQSCVPFCGNPCQGQSYIPVYIPGCGFALVPQSCCLNPCGGSCPWSSSCCQPSCCYPVPSCCNSSSCSQPASCAKCPCSSCSKKQSS